MTLHLTPRHPTPRSSGILLALACAVPFLPGTIVAQAVAYPPANQPPSQETPQQQLIRLTRAIDQAQAQIDASQRQLLELKQSLAALTAQMAAAQPPAATPLPPVQQATAAPSDLEDRQTMQESQIATLDQSKVESESKYPVKVDGLILFSTFVNTRATDQPATPSLALTGAGATGATLRQTILGIDARGPRLAGADSHADLRVDFFGSSAQGTYANAGGLLRFRTAHANLDWQHSHAFVELDRPILSPNTPTSLTAVALPALSWSGNLWTWAPQLGFSQDIPLTSSSHVNVEAALMDVPDPPSFAAATTTSTVAVASQAEQSRWPGTELHVAFTDNHADSHRSLGFGGYFSPHRTPGGLRYDAWAATLDAHTRLPLGFDLSGSFYRGSALGGLGGGAYKDYLYYVEYKKPEAISLDDVGGWAQLKKHLGSRLELNAAYGLDNAFTGELRRFAYISPTSYQNLARNQTFFTNFIYSPKSYLLFSLEYRHLKTIPIVGDPAATHVIGLAAGYRF